MKAWASSTASKKVRFNEPEVGEVLSELAFVMPEAISEIAVVLPLPTSFALVA